MIKRLWNYILVQYKLSILLKNKKNKSYYKKIKNYQIRGIRMALQLILGRAGSGKSYTLIQKIISLSMKMEEKNFVAVEPDLLMQYLKNWELMT